MNEAMEAIEKKAKEETDNNVSKSLLENTSQEADSDVFRSHDSESALMVTAQDTQYVDATMNQSTGNPDSLALNITNGDNALLAENRGLQEELTLRTQSLQDTQAKVEELKSRAATALRQKEHLEAQIASKDSELTKLAGVVKALKLTLEKQTPDTKDNLIKKQKNKITALERSLDEAKAEAKTATEVAEKQRSVTAGFEVTQRAHLAEIKILKRQTLCLDPDCTSEKICGRSHSKKEENLGQCSYFNFGRCNQENCKYKHDAAAKLKKERRKRIRKTKRKKRRKMLMILQLIPPPNLRRRQRKPKSPRARNQRLKSLKYLLLRTPRIELPQLHPKPQIKTSTLICRLRSLINLLRPLGLSS